VRTVSTIAGDFDATRLKRLREAYAQAVKAKQSEFIFDGGKLLVDFARYLIEYLKGELK